MASNLQVDEQVFVPLSALKKEVQSPSAFYRTKVLAVTARSVSIDVGNGDIELVAASKCQRNIGIAIYSIGDLETESLLIEPLSKSILQFSRLLCSDDYVKSYRVRSVCELTKCWARDNGAHSHIVIIGHGNGSALNFAVDGWVSAEDMSKALDVNGVTPKIFLNLSCKLGQADYGKVFSKSSVCKAFIAPFHSVHGAIASHFAQTFLIYNLLHGETVKVAFRHARESVADKKSFRMWRGGEMIADSKKVKKADSVADGLPSVDTQSQD